MVRSKSSQSQISLQARKRIMNELQYLSPIADNKETNPTRIEVALRERIKELNCLYKISLLADRYSNSIDDLLQNMVDILPPSWQYPEITCARIVFQGKSYKSRGFKMTKWRQVSQILMYNEPEGEVEVLYLEERPPEDEGPFLKEERVLLNAVAEQIGKIAMRVAAEKELQEINKQLTVERRALQEANAALKAVLSRIAEEKQNIYKNVHSNVEKVLMPILHALTMELPIMQRKYVDMIRTGLEEIASPFINHLSSRFLALTPTEIKICNMIRNGLRTKEIAKVQGVSMATINRHREHIRQKLEIANHEINLTTFLQSNMWREEKA